MKDGKIFTLSGVQSLLPSVNGWALELFKKSLANHWVPNGIPMGDDIQDWVSNRLSEDEKLLVRRSLGFFAGSEILVGNNLLLKIFNVVSDPECKQYIIRQSFEESIHNLTVIYICDSLGLKVDEVYEAYQHIPSIKKKDEFLKRITSDINQNLNTDGSLFTWLLNYKKEALKNIISYYMICEGIFFYSGFAMMLNFGRQGKLLGISQQIQYTLRDEVLHIEFGRNLINKIIEQEPLIWTEDFKKEIVNIFEEAVGLEIEYAYDVLPRGVLGLTAGQFVDYVKYIANRRLEGIGLSPIYVNARNPFLWMTEAIDITKQKNFFETKVIDYQSSSTLTDDF